MLSGFIDEKVISVNEICLAPDEDMQIKLGSNQIENLILLIKYKLENTVTLQTYCLYSFMLSKISTISSINQSVFV